MKAFCDECQHYHQDEKFMNVAVSCMSKRGLNRSLTLTAERDALAACCAALEACLRHYLAAYVEDESIELAQVHTEARALLAALGKETT
jgi:hypothetical protein